MSEQKRLEVQAPPAPLRPTPVKAAVPQVRPTGYGELLKLSQRAGRWALDHCETDDELPRGYVVMRAESVEKVMVNVGTEAKPRLLPGTSTTTFRSLLKLRDDCDLCFDEDCDCMFHVVYSEGPGAPASYVLQEFAADIGDGWLHEVQQHLDYRRAELTCVADQAAAAMDEFFGVGQGGALEVVEDGPEGDAWMDDIEVDDGE